MKKTLICLFILSVMLFSGCQKKDNVLSPDNAVDTPRQNMQQNFRGNMNFAKITKIYDNKIELTLAKMPERPQGDSPQGNPPPERRNNNQESPQRPQDGERPQQGRRMINDDFVKNLEFTDETKEVEITEDTEIFTAGADGQKAISFAELKIDSIVSYTEEDGSIKIIRIIE